MNESNWYDLYCKLADKSQYDNEYEKYREAMFEAALRKAQVEYMSDVNVQAWLVRYGELATGERVAEIIEIIQGQLFGVGRRSPTIPRWRRSDLSWLHFYEGICVGKKKALFKLK